MKITDCYWERENLNKKVVEINIDTNDEFDRSLLENSTKGYGYACIKVPVGKTDFNFGLTDMGYTMIECQYRIVKYYKHFNFEDRTIKRQLSDIKIKEVNSDADFNMILDNMTPDMFSTYRIVLDSKFGKEYGFRRYQNWMQTEYEKKTSMFLLTYFHDQVVGFGMFRNDTLGYDGLLGGIFTQYQGFGLGWLICCQPFVYAYQKSLPFKRMITSISSNNVPVVELYNYFDFKVKDTRYVYVKHND